MDSFHECLQEYGEGLEVVQICLEPEDSSMKDEISAIADFSFDESRKEKSNYEIKEKGSMERINGDATLNKSKSEESLDQDDDLTITEDDVLVMPRELTDIRSKSVTRKDENERCLSKQQSKDISTSDEMVFAVTPTGLERISFDKYWKESDDKIEKMPLEKVISDESWKECLNSPTDETSSFYDATTRISVQEDSNSLLYIDHEIDGYETCLDDDSNSVKCTIKNDRKLNSEDIKAESKHNKIAVSYKDNDASAKQNVANAVDEVTSYGHPYVQEHIIKQMKSLRIEPINVNISSKKKKRSPTKPSKNERRCVEYYNDQDECLKEIRKKKLEEEIQYKEERTKKLKSNLATMEKKLQLKKDPSEDSTDLESNYVPGCHKCFLENYAYAITKAYLSEADACKYCEVIRGMLEVSKRCPERRMSAPALLNMDSAGSETDEEDFLTVPGVKHRRKSAGPLKFLVPSRRPSYAPLPTMTVTVSPDRRADAIVAQRWGAPRKVTLKRTQGAPLGVSIVGGKVDIVSSNDSDDGEEKAIFGIFIKNVVPDSPAGNCGELHTGDRILEVDGVCVRSAQHERAVQLIKAAGDKVTLTVQSLLAWNTDSSDVDPSSPPPTPTHSARKSSTPSRSPASARKSPLPARKSPAPLAVIDGTPEHEIKITVTSDPEEKGAAESEKETEKESSEGEGPKPVYSDSESSDEEDERDLGGRTYSEKGSEIDRASAGAIKRSKEEKEADLEEEDDFGYTTRESP